jgi:hypothetical protein
MILRMVDDVPHGTIKFRISRKIGFCNAFSVDDFSPGEGQDFPDSLFLFEVVRLIG